MNHPVTFNECHSHHVLISATDASILRPPMSPTRKHPQDLQNIFKSIQGLVSDLYPTQGAKRGQRALIIKNLDVLIRIKRNLNNAEEATRSTSTLGADLTHVASLAESFSQLRGRTSAVKSDLVDALDREGQVFFPLLLELPELLQSNPGYQQMNETFV